jgi:hypothetical protein
MEKSTTLPLEVVPIEDEGFHIIVAGKINGAPARLLIDTGASRTVFDALRIKSFPGIDPETFMEMDKLSTGLGTNTMQSHTIVLNEFELGKLSIKEYEVVVIDMVHVNQSYGVLEIPEIDGVLGGDILYDYNAVIDYNNEELILKRKKPAH